MEGHTVKYRILALVLLSLFMSSQADSEQLYRWVDDTGKIHVVDDIGKVPKRYQKGMKIYRSPSTRRERPPARKKAAPVVSPAAPEGKGKTDMVPPQGPEGEFPGIEALHERKKALEKERDRLRVMETRYRTKKSRSTIYKKRIEEINQEIEAIQRDLDTVSPKSR
jgi:hypothetical protein